MNLTNTSAKPLTAVYDSDAVEIYLQFQRIALYKRGYKKHDYTLKEHMLEGHQRYFEQRGWTADYFLRQASVIGTVTKGYIEQLFIKGKALYRASYVQKERIS